MSRPFYTGIFDGIDTEDIIGLNNLNIGDKALMVSGSNQFDKYYKNSFDKKERIRLICYGNNTDMKYEIKKICLFKNIKKVLWKSLYKEWKMKINKICGNTPFADCFDIDFIFDKYIKKYNKLPKYFRDYAYLVVRVE
tara:strand:- start:485 stop:898 length:414 start_codon:yes stop_codon:yes gene_type:complete